MMICLVGIFALFVFISLKTTDNENVQKKYLDMVKNPIFLDVNGMQCRIGDKDTAISYDDKLYKMVVFVDSTECFSCTLKDLSLWNDYIKDSLSYGKYINYYFIFSSKKSDVSYVYSTIAKRGIPFPVFVDTANIFEKENPQIPRESEYHVFLLNKDYKIKLVGNPLKNKKISMMLKQIVDSASINFKR